MRGTWEIDGGVKWSLSLSLRFFFAFVELILHFFRLCGGLAKGGLIFFICYYCYRETVQFFCLPLFRSFFLLRTKDMTCLKGVFLYTEWVEPSFHSTRSNLGHVASLDIRLAEKSYLSFLGAWKLIFKLCTRTLALEGIYIYPTTPLTPRYRPSRK